MATLGAVTIRTLQESVDDALATFNVFSDSPPNLVPTGIRAVDDCIGGLFAGSAGILAAATGVGKSSVVLSAALSSTARSGIISTEDTPDVVGSRILAWESGVDSLNIRRKIFARGETAKLAAVRDRLGGRDNVLLAYPTGGQLEEVLESIAELAAAGCRIVWLDYLQKIRGFKDDRRNEVSGVYTACQRVAARVGVALMVVSQFARQLDPSRQPQIWWLKESGDLENEARLILLAVREGSGVTIRIAKSAFGGEGCVVTYVRDASGSLRERTTTEDEL